MKEVHGRMVSTKEIPHAPGYFVSSDGSVCSSKYGGRRQLKPWVSNKSGHLRITLRVDNGVIKEYVHRLVATLFIGQPPSELHEVRHLDGEPSNNSVSNLAWGTHTENMQDMVRHGRQGAYRHPENMPRGERHGSRTKPHRVARGEKSGVAKIDEDMVRRIRVTFAETRNISETARRCDVSRGVTKCIIQQKTWKHVI